MISDNPIIARYQWTYHLHQLGGMLHKRTKRKQSLRNFILISIPLLIAVVVVSSRENLWVTLILFWFLTFVGLIAMLFTFVVIRPFLTKWQFERSPGANLETEWTFSPESISVTNPLGTISGDWSTFAEIHCSEYGFILNSKKEGSFFVPYDAFQTMEHIEALKGIARDHGVLHADQP